MLYNWSTIGHEQALTALENDIRTNTLAHAYLFVGADGIGKTHVAQMLAGILQCPNDFCRTCPTCTQVLKGIHQDTMVLADDGETIKIQTVRELLERINLSTQSRYKVVLIEDVARLTIEAANALLKTLEEPPSNTIFIGTIRDVKGTLATIVSRMRVINFKKPSIKSMREGLVALYPQTDVSVIDQALALSFGAGGTAKKLIENPEALYELKKEFDHLAYLYEKEGLAERIVHMGELSKDDKESGAAKKFLAQLTLFLHGKLHDENSSDAQRLKVIENLERTHAAIQLYEKNINTRMLLEHLHINLAQ